MLFFADAIWILLLAFAFDALIGGAERIWRHVSHPAAWLGKFARLLQHEFDRPDWNDRRRLMAGIAAMAVLVALTFLAGWLIERLIRMIPAGQVLLALIASLFIAQRSIYDHVVHVATAFAMGGLPWAREAVAATVGADANRLDRAGVCRVAIECSAQSFATDVVAPAFWFALLGLPGLLTYQAISTAADMMSCEHHHSGFTRAFARSNDVVSYVPSRIAGLILSAVAFAAGGSAIKSVRALWRDAGPRRLLNAGWPLSAAAGALGLVLGGPQIRHGYVVDEPLINPQGRRPATPEDIDRVRRLLFAACLLQIVLYAGLSLVRR